MRPEDRELVDRCTELPIGTLLALYTDLADNSPEWAAIAASAIRIRARAGDVPEELVPILALCLTTAPDEGAFLHLSKALAAFGRLAQLAAPTVARRADAILVRDDVDFWVLDGALHVLGYLGGPSAEELVGRLEREDPARVNARDTIYQGNLTAEERARLHGETLARVRGMLALEDAGAWTGKLTTRTWDDVRVAEPLPPWKVR